VEGSEVNEFDAYNKKRLQLVAQFSRRVELFQSQFDQDYKTLAPKVGTVSAPNGWNT
jgi:hypothetical protein